MNELKLEKERIKKFFENITDEEFNQLLISNGYNLIKPTREIRDEYINLLINNKGDELTMNKEDFIKTFAHFMTESDLNKAYDLHFKELGNMTYKEIVKWLKEVLDNK